MNKNTRRFSLVLVVSGLFILQVGLCGCASKPVLVDFSQETVPVLSREEAWRVVNEQGLNNTFPYYREELTSSWITSYDGQQIRKSEHVMKTYTVSLEELLAASDHYFNCLYCKKTSRYIIQGVFTDKMGQKAEVELLAQSDREKARDVLQALSAL